MNDRLGGTTTDYDSGNIIPYRIIGVFKDMELSDGTKRDLIKVIRNDSIGDYSWDNKTNGIGSSVSIYGCNDWTDSRLMMMLNPEYDDYSETNPLKDASGNIVYGYKGSLWWNSNSGSCYAGNNNATIACDFTSNGLSRNVQNKIETVVWNLGGTSDTSLAYPNNAYKSIVDGEVYKNADIGITRSTKWTGKVALIYASDYGYATDFSNCNQVLKNYDENDCEKNDWLYTENIGAGAVGLHWLLSTHSGVSHFVNILGNVGRIYSGFEAKAVYGVRPSFYLDSELSIVSGDGTKDRPYVLD